MVTWMMMVCLCGAETGQQWPGFRGQGNNVAEVKSLPRKWSDEEGIRWKAELQGYGQSSPVVWGDKVFVTSVEGPKKQKLILAAYSMDQGEKLWAKEFEASQTAESTDYVSKASPTPHVDAERLIVMFESGDLLALNHQGETLWQRSLTKEYGAIQGAHGLGASLAATEKEVLVLVAHEGPSYLLSVQKSDGKNRWKTDLTAGVSWTSPHVNWKSEPQQVVVSSAGRVEAYDLAEGKPLWKLDGLEGNTVPSPTAAGGLVLIGSSQSESNMVLKIQGTGTETKPEVVWKSESASSSFGSPLLFGDQAYFVNRAGVAFAVEATTGKELWNARLPGSCWASPLGALDRVYFFTKDGPTWVVQAGPKLEVLAENVLPVPGRVYGVAAVEGRFVVRTGTHLVCIGK